MVYVFVNYSCHCQVMVATVRCEEIAREKFNQLTHDEVHNPAIFLLFFELLEWWRNFIVHYLHGHDIGLVGLGGCCTEGSYVRAWKEAELNPRKLPL